MNKKSGLDDWKKVQEIIGLLTAILGPPLALWAGWISIPQFDSVNFQKAVLTFVWIAIVGFIFVFVRMDKVVKK